MNKKRLKKRRNNKKEIYEKAFLYETPGYEIDEYSVQYGRTSDERRADVECRHTRKPNICRGDRCDIELKIK